MASDWCICNIGTGHAADEPDNILVKVFRSVKAGHINNGPGFKGGDLLGNLFGHGLDDRLEQSMASLPSDAGRVFLVGHSRGAILSYLVANELQRQKPALEVHIFNVDPVSRYAKNTSDKDMVRRNVRSVKAIVMENDNAPGIGIGNMFQLTFVRGAPGLDIEYIPMPGTHGSATQVNIHNPIGMAAYQMALRWLDGHGVPLNIKPGPVPSLCNTFFEIHEKNPVQGFTASGGVSARTVTDWDAKTPAGRTQAGQNRRDMLAKAGISNPHSAGGGDKFSNPGLFINAYHSDLFRASYPASHDLLTKSAPEMSRLRITSGARTSLQREIATLRSYHATWKVLTALGMANRLESSAANPV
jgi:hypothetical protein